MTNRFKGLDLIGRVPEEISMEIHNTVEVVVTRTIPKKKKCKTAKWLSEEALQIANKRRERQRKKGKKQINQTNQINLYFCFTDYTRAFDCGSQQTVKNA